MPKTHKNCFGDLDRVFPMGDKGLREIVPACYDCRDKKACLEAALLTKEGLAFKREILKRSPVKGLVGRIRRWSELKTINKLMEGEKGIGK